MEIEKVKHSIIHDLQHIIDNIDRIRLIKKLSYKFNTKYIGSSQYRDNFISKIKENINHNKYKYIYTFRLPDGYPADKVYHNYENAKSSISERAFARLNKANKNSLYLYVGSSLGLVSRIKQHLGFGPKGTYAMQLYSWCKNLNIEITLNIYAFDSEISKNAFQAFEDGVWNYLKPLLGRQGKK